MKAIGDRVEVPGIDECGPAMRALTEKQRRYVAALGTFGNHQTAAYQWAFSVEKVASANAASSKLAAQDKIKAAVQEFYLDKRTRIMPAMITDGLLEMMGPTQMDDKAKLKAIQLAIDLVPGMKAAVQMELTVHHKLSLPELEDKARRLQKQLALPQLVSPDEIVDAEYEEVVTDDDLADIL